MSVVLRAGVSVMRGEVCDDGRAGAIPGAAISGPESSGPHIRGKIVPEFALVARDVWSVKAPAALHQYTMRSERTCRAWCADVEAPASAAFALLRSDEGYRFLRRVMRDNPPPWWVNIERLRAIGAACERAVIEL